MNIEMEARTQKLKIVKNERGTDILFCPRYNECLDNYKKAVAEFQFKIEMQREEYGLPKSKEPEKIENFECPYHGALAKIFKEVWDNCKKNGGIRTRCMEGRWPYTEDEAETMQETLRKENEALEKDEKEYNDRMKKQ